MPYLSAGVRRYSLNSAGVDLLFSAVPLTEVTSHSRSMAVPVLVNEAGKRLVSDSEASWCGIAFAYMEHSYLKLFWPPKQSAWPDVD